MKNKWGYSFVFLSTIACGKGDYVDQYIDSKREAASMQCERCKKEHLLPDETIEECIEFWGYDKWEEECLADLFRSPEAQGLEAYVKCETEGNRALAACWRENCATNCFSEVDDSHFSKCPSVSPSIQAKIYDCLGY